MNGESKRFIEIETSSTPEGAAKLTAKPVENKKPESSLTPGRVSLEEGLRKIGGVLEIHVWQSKRDGSLVYKGSVQMNTETETEEDIYNKTLKTYGSGTFHFKCKLSDGKNKEWKVPLDNPLYPNTFEPKPEVIVEKPETPAPVAPIIQPTNDKSLEVMTSTLNSLIAMIGNKGGDPELMAEVRKLREKVEGIGATRYDASTPAPSEDSLVLDEIMTEIRNFGARLTRSEVEAQKRIEDDKRERKEAERERKEAERQKEIDNLTKELVSLRANPPAATESMSDTVLKIAEIMKPSAKDGLTLEKITPFIPFLTPLFAKLFDPTSALEKGVALAMQISGDGGSGNTDWGSVARGFVEKAGGKAIENLDPQLIAGFLSSLADGKQPAIGDMTKNPELAQTKTKPAIEPKPQEPEVEIKPKPVSKSDATNVIVSSAVKQSLELIKQGKTEEATITLLSQLPLQNTQELANDWTKMKNVFTYVDQDAKKYAKGIKDVFGKLKEQFVDGSTSEPEKLKPEPKVDPKPAKENPKKEKPKAKKKEKVSEPKIEVKPVVSDKPEVNEKK